MTVTITGINKAMGITEKMAGVDWDRVTTKEIRKRNGFNVFEVRIENGKRDIRFTSGNYNIITVQEEETGRYLVKHER